jgi:SnoaL-like domain
MSCASGPAGAPGRSLWRSVARTGTTRSRVISRAVMDADFIEDFGDRWQDAVNRRAVDEILAFCAEDVRIEDPGLAQAATGREAVRAFFAQTWSAFPDLRFSRPDAPYLLAPDAPVAVAAQASLQYEA